MCALSCRGVIAEAAAVVSSGYRREALEKGAGTAISEVLQETTTSDGLFFLQVRASMCAR
jgi:hypothetical protein